MIAALAGVLFAFDVEHVEVAFDVAEDEKGARGRLFDHLVGAGEQGRWNFDADCFGGLQIDDEFEFACLDYRQVCRFLPLENAADIDTSLPDHVRCIGSVAHQPAGVGKITIGAYGGHRMTRSQDGDLQATPVH